MNHIQTPFSHLMPFSARQSGFLKKISLFSIVCMMSAQTVSAHDLKDILKASLLSDPTVLEAKATEESAKSTTKATRAGHYPILTLTGVQVLAEKKPRPKR